MYLRLTQNQLGFMLKLLNFSKLFFLSYIALISTVGFSQNKERLIKGEVVDSSSNEAIPYATILLKGKDSTSVIGGTTSNETGEFQIENKEGGTYLEIKFIGFETKTISKNQWVSKNFDLGQISLQASAQSLNTVEVTAEKSTMEFKLDKRVFNVGSDISSTGMGALEVLNNVPSVNVDIEGNITLRGNAGVQILIDGKPTASDDPANVLGALTADMIESIEVITNPSAKYNAEGTSGILNIILKKEEKKGVNGSISVNTGIPHNHSVGASINLRTEKFNFFTQFGAGYRSLPNFNETSNIDFTNGQSVSSTGINYRNENFYNITLGTDYHINDWNIITLSGNFAYEIESQPSSTEFTILDSNNTVISRFERVETTSALNPKWQYDLNYTKKFKNHKDHILLFSTQGRFFGKDLSSEFSHNTFEGNIVLNDQQINTDFYQADYTFKLDYTNPITEVFSIESGAMYEINDVGNDFSAFDLVNGTANPDSSLTNNFIFIQKVLGIYATTAFEWGKFGFKTGLRVENTDLQTELVTTAQKNNRNYTNLFPSFHTSYKFNKYFSVQAGYSRRIFRPRLWDLNPFFNIRNTFSIRTGNPDLLPEFGDSYELTAIWIREKMSLNGSIYHLYTDAVIERVTTFEDNVATTSPINVGTRNKTGVELNGKYQPAKWFALTGDFNYGFFSRQGEFQGQNFNFSANQWSGRLTSKFDLKWDLDFELTGNYESSYETVQGLVSGFFYADVGVRKKLWGGKGVINFAVRDVFFSRIRESFAEQADFYSYSFSQRGRFITLGFSYSFGKGEAIAYTGRRR
jgi:outer membrane receptor protein involved in Fe transport